MEEVGSECIRDRGTTMELDDTAYTQINVPCFEELSLSWLVIIICCGGDARVGVEFAAI